MVSTVGIVIIAAAQSVAKAFIIGIAGYASVKCESVINESAVHI